MIPVVIAIIAASSSIFFKQRDAMMDILKLTTAALLAGAGYLAVVMLVRLIP